MSEERTAARKPTSSPQTSPDVEHAAVLPTRDDAATSLAIVRSVAEELGGLEWRSVVLRERLYDAVRDACEAGTAQSTVALAAGISRQRVHQILALLEPPEEET